MGNERKKLEQGDSNSRGVLETLTLQTGPLPLLQTGAEAPRARAAGPGHSGVCAPPGPPEAGAAPPARRGRAGKGGPGDQEARGPVLTALAVSRVLGIHLTALASVTASEKWARLALVLLCLVGGLFSIRT